MEKVVIDVEGKFTDNITTAAHEAIGALERLAKTKVFVKFDADNSPFLKAINTAEAQAQKFGKNSSKFKITAEDKVTPIINKIDAAAKKICGPSGIKATITTEDKALTVIDAVSNKGKNIDGSNWKAIVVADDKASPILEKVNAQEQKFKNSKWKTVLDAVDKASPILKKIYSTGQKIKNATWRVTVGVVDKTTAPLRKIFSLLKSPVLQAGAALGIGLGVSDVIGTYAGFESTMSQVGAISGAGYKEMSALTAKAKEMGATTKFTAEEAGSAMKYMAMAGWEASDMISGISGVMNLAAASGESLATTSDIVTDALTAFKLQASDSSHFADVLAAATAKSNTTVGMMGDTFKYVGTQAGTLGYKIEDVALATGLMANAGVKGSMAGTALSSVWTRLSTNTSGATDAIKALGVQFYDNYGNARRWKTVMDELRTATAGMTTEQKTALASTIAGQDAQKGFLAILEASATDYNNLSTAIENANGAAKSMSEIMLDNLSGSITKLQSAADGVKNSIGERLTPYLHSGLDWLTGKMPDVENAVGKAMDYVETKIQKGAKRLKEITGSTDFQDASFGEKISMLWKGAIIDPLGEWWSNGGQQKTVESAGVIGKGAGETLKGALLGIFGTTNILETDRLGESAGASVAQSFTKGLMDGFDASLVTAKLGDALGNVWEASPTWGKMLMGGVVSSKLIGGISKAALKAKSFIGTSAATRNSPFGSGLLGLGMKTAVNVGGLKPGAVLTAGQMSALGLGELAGGLAGIASVASGINDLVQASKLSDKTDKKAYNASGSSKILGTGTGAGIGFAFGGLPGALIGAGIGGLAGWATGYLARRDIQKTGNSAEYMAEKEAEAAQQAQELKVRMDKLASTSLDKHFGDITLSAAEMSQTIGNLVGQDKISEANRFAAIFGDVEKSFDNTAQASNDFKKNLWLAGSGNFGGKATQEQIDNLKSSMDALSESSKKYLSDSRYASEESIRSLVGNEKQAKAILESSGNYYSGLKNQLQSKISELSNTVTKALADGVIDPIDEEASIQKIRSDIDKINAELAQADFQGEINLLNAKSALGQVTPDTFGSIIKGAHESASNLAEQAKTKYKSASIGITDPNQLKTLRSGMLREQGSAFLPVGNWGFDTLKQQYRQELGMFSSDIGDIFQNNTVSEIMAQVPKVTTQTQAAIGKFVEGLQPTTDQLRSIATGYKALGQQVPQDIQQYLNTADMFSALSQGSDSMRTFLNSHRNDMPKEMSKFQEEFRKSIEQQQASGELFEIHGTAKADIDVESDGDIAGKVKKEIESEKVEPEITGTAKSKFDVESDGSIADKVKKEAESEKVEAEITGTAKTDLEVETNGSIADKVKENIGKPETFMFTTPVENKFELTGETETDLPKLLAMNSLTSPTPLMMETPVENKFIPAGETEPDTSKLFGSERTIEPKPVMMSTQIQNKFEVTGETAPDTSTIVGNVPTTIEPVPVTVPIQIQMQLSGETNFNISSIIAQIQTVAEPITVNVPVSVNGEFQNANQFSYNQSAFGIAGSYTASTAISINATFPIANRFSFSQSAFGINSNYTASTTVTINVSYAVNKGPLPNLRAGIPKARGGIIGPNGPMGFSEGGMVRGGPQLITVAEEGTPEMIIPLGSQRRQRGLQLWRKAGHMLGVEGYADGGIAGAFGRMAEPSVFQPQEPRRKELEPLQYRQAESQAGSGSAVSINVGDIDIGGVTLKVDVDGTSGDVVAGIEQNKDKIADIIAGVMRKAVEATFINTPLLGGETV